MVYYSKKIFKKYRLSVEVNIKCEFEIKKPDDYFIFYTQFNTIHDVLSARV